MTASPKPAEVFTVLETARYEHIPKKYAKIILSTKIERTNKLNRFSMYRTTLYKFYVMKLRLVKVWCQGYFFFAPSTKDFTKIRCTQIMHPTKISAMGGIIKKPLFS